MPSYGKVIHIYGFYNLNIMATKRVVRDGLNAMPLVLKNTPPAKIQTIVAAKWNISLFFRNQRVILEHCQSEYSYLLLCKKCKRWGNLQTFLVWKCSFVHVIIKTVYTFQLLEIIFEKELFSSY